MEPKMFKCGCINLLDNEDGNFLSKAIRFFTHSQISHCDFTMGNIIKEESVFSAQLLMSVLPLKSYIHDENYIFTTYEILGIEEAALEEIIQSMYIDFAGKIYGYKQLLWFVYRWLMEKFGKDVRKQNNWFSSNAICSELVYLYLKRVAKLLNSRNLMDKLNEWNANTASPEDIKVIVQQFPWIFKKRMFCNRTKITLYA